MSLLFMDSFDYSDVFPTVSAANFGNMLRRKYSQVDTTTFIGGETDSFARAGPHGGTALEFGSRAHHVRPFPLRDAAVSSTGIVGFRMKLRENKVLQTDKTFLIVYAGNAVQIQFVIQPSGTIEVIRGTLFFLERSPPIFHTNQGWQYIEIKFNIHDSTGNWEIRRDGNVVWTSSNWDTRSEAGVYWDSVRFSLGGLSLKTIIDDIYICDGAGSVNNDYLGDTVVQFINPSSDGDSSTFTPSSGTNHSALVDEAQAMTDALDETDHVEGDATGEKDLFQYENLASPGLSTASLLHGVQVTTYRRITAEQPEDLKIVAKTGITEGTVTHTVRHDDTTDMFGGTSIFELDPDTAVAWTPSGVDGAQFGVEMP